MKENNNTCNTCDKVGHCEYLCKDMNKLLENKKSNNGIYADSTEDGSKKFMHKDSIERLIYTQGLSQDEKDSAKRIIISILKPEQKMILELYAQGYNQVAIAKKLGITQSSVSQRIKSIRNEIREAFVKVIDYMVS